MRSHYINSHLAALTKSTLTQEMKEINDLGHSAPMGN